MRVMVVTPESVEARSYHQSALRHAARSASVMSCWVDGDSEEAQYSRINGPFDWIAYVDLVAVYIDAGKTKNMRSIAAAARAAGVLVEYRTIQPRSVAQHLLDLFRGVVGAGPEMAGNGQGSPT